MINKEKSLEMEIEALRDKLYRDNPNFHKIRKMDQRTYILSVKIDKLINKYMKKTKPT